MFLDQFGQVADVAEEPVHAALEGLQRRAEEVVVGDGGDGVVEFAVGPVRFEDGALCEEAFGIVQKPGEALEVIFGGPACCQPAGEHFEGFADVEQVFHVLGAQPCHLGATGGTVPDEALLAQHAQGFPDGQARHVELGGQVTFHEAGAGGVVAFEDPGAEGVPHGLAEGAVGGGGFFCCQHHCSIRGVFSDFTSSVVCIAVQSRTVLVDDLLVDDGPLVDGPANDGGLKRPNAFSRATATASTSRSR